MPDYDAVLIVSFGGPEGPDEVLPFLENVLRGKNVPHARLLEVAEHYHHFGGISPINAQNRSLIAALEVELKQHGPALPIYWGNRNWRPLLPDTLRQMTADGVRHAIAFVTSAFGSYSGCRQYLDDIERARQSVGAGAPQVDKLRVFYNHPGFIEPMIERVQTAFDQLPAAGHAAARLVYTAHSVPQTMADASPYVASLREACRLVAEALNRPEWELAYQSRSGAPGQPWLEPDVCEVLRRLQSTGAQDVVVVPIGFLSDHMEVLYDLDVEAASVAKELKLNLVRAGTVGCHPRFIRMIRELIVERAMPGAERVALGNVGPSPDVCAAGCCPAPVRPQRAS